MRILVLNRFALKFVPYRSYIDPAHDLVLITSPGGAGGDPDERARNLDGYEQAIVLDDYATSAHVEYRANVLHAEKPFDAIVSMSEFDLTTAARLRRAWGIAGQTVESVLAYRDKLEMKRILAAAGVPVAPFAPVNNATDLIAFTRGYGYPVVVKPRRGASSEGVRVLRGEDDLVAYLGVDSPLLGDTPADMQVEVFIPNEMYNVDGIVLNGELRVCWPTATTSCLGFETDDILIATALEAGEPWQAELVDITRRALEALPTPPTTLFHAEVFRTPDGDLIFNEIGCRIGGGRIWDQFRVGFDVDLIGSCVQGMYGPDRDAPIANSTPIATCGWMLVRPKRGVVTSVPENCPIPNIEIYDAYVAVGETLGEASSSVDAMAAFLVKGGTRDEIEKTLRDAADWFYDSLGLAPLG